MTTRLLLLSNSRAPDGTYLRWPRDQLVSFLGPAGKAPGIKEVLFIPYAEVPATREAYDQYAANVRAVFVDMGYALRSIHEADDPVAAVREAAAIVVGGGNSFQLLTEVYRHGLREVIVERVRAGVPYIGWSAGSNLACPGIWTTNDMPIVEPASLRALGLVPFQINPHFTDAHPPGHQGETRSERIAEFLALHPQQTVVGLREGALLHVADGKCHVAGAGARIFRAGQPPFEAGDGAELDLR